MTREALSDEEIRQFRELGFVLQTPGLGIGLAEKLQRHLPNAAAPIGSNVLEADGRTLRAMHGNHLEDAVFAELVRLPHLLGAAETLVGSPVYVYQFKINMKAALSGGHWPWHDDFVYWRNEDGMPEPRAVTAALFLDPVTEFNGPLYFIPKSHIAHEAAPPKAASWQESVSENLTYQAGEERVKALADSNGIVAPHGPPGSILFFDSRILHASGSNLSQNDRRIVFITYNSVTNAPTALRRPEFLVGYDTTPLTPAVPRHGAPDKDMRG